MTRQVVWSRQALTELGEAFAYVAQTDVRYAHKLIDQIEDAANRLGAHPTGRPGRSGRTHEKSLPKLRYVIAYALDDPPGNVTILRVIHASRDWPKGAWPR